MTSMRQAAAIVVSTVASFLAANSAINAQVWPAESYYAVRGVTVYDQDELLTFAAQHTYDATGRITAQGVAETVAQIYREDGYFLAEAWVLPDGKTIVVDEGHVERVDIEGVDTKKFDAIEGLFQPLIGVRPLTLKRFERSVMLAEDIPDLDLSTELDYLGGDGARLRVLGEQLSKQAGSATLDNPPRELGDALSLYVIQEFYSSLSAGDLLRFEGAGTLNWEEDDTNSLWGALTYRTPFGSNGFYGEAYYGNVAARRDISGEFTRTDFEGQNAALAFGFPFQRDVASYGYGLLEYRYTESDSETAGVDFSSAANIVAASYLYGRTYNTGQSLEVGATLSFGENDSGNGGPGVDDGDDSFWHLRAGVGYDSSLPAVSENTSWRAEVWSQYTNSRLPSVEEFFLGDRYSLRGYRFDEADGDSGVSALLEVSHSIIPESGSVERWSPFAFIDIGYITNNDPASFEIDNMFLASAGVGVDIDLQRNLFLSGYVGVPLRDGPITDAGDPGVYLSLTTSW